LMHGWKWVVCHICTLIVLTPLSNLCEFLSNFLFTNIECVTPSISIILEYNGELKITLQIIFTNLFEFNEQKTTCKNKFIRYNKKVSQYTK